MFKYEILEKICTISQENGFSLQLNVISFNDRLPKYDLRRWDDQGEESRMSKGVSVSKNELKALRDVLNRLDL